MLDGFLGILTSGSIQISVVRRTYGGSDKMDTQQIHVLLYTSTDTRPCTDESELTRRCKANSKGRKGVGSPEGIHENCKDPTLGLTVECKGLVPTCPRANQALRD